MNRIHLTTAATLVLASCGGTAEAPGPDLAPVELNVSHALVSAAATVHPARVVSLREAEVATRVAGTIARMAVEVGDRVARGALIATLDDADVRARIESAEAQARLAESTFSRIQNLARDGAASPHELDQARAAMELALATVREAGAEASYVEIRAPFAGVVTARSADAGALALPGRPIVRLEGGGVKVVADLPAAEAGRIRVGDGVEVDTGTRLIPGTVQIVVPSLDAASRRFRVEVTPAPGTDLLPGTFVRLLFPGDGGEETVWVPEDALVRSGQLTGLYTLRGDTVHLRWVRPGRRQTGRVELLAGPAGELIIVRRPPPELLDGSPAGRVTVEPFGDGEG